MIPLTLELTNFLSYKEMPEPLDLSHVHVACLSGANGNGKSALLDAITWVLWGKARGSEGGQDQEKLIRDGADSARVELTFALDGQNYRVVRGRNRKGKADLHLSVRDGEGWTDMAAESVTATQAAISKLLRMEYETFVASAYILQGRADEFTTMEASKRKDTLGRVLGLEIYERLAERARERKREHSGRAEALRTDAEVLEASLVEVPATEAALRDAQASAATAQNRRVEAAATFADAQQRLAEVQAIEVTARQIEQRRIEAQTSLERAQSDVSSLERDLAEAQAAVAEGDPYRDLASRRPVLEGREREMNDAQTRASALTEAIGELQTRIAVERRRLETEREAAAKIVIESRAETDAVAGAADLLRQAQEALRTLDEAAAEREMLLERHRALETEHARQQTEVAHRGDRRKDLLDRASRIEAADAECPVCEQPLEPEHRAKIAAEVRESLAALDRGDAESVQAVKRIEAELSSTKKRGTELKVALAKRDEIQRHVATLEERIARASDARLRLQEATQTVASLGELIASDADSPTEREKLASMIAERASIGYDEAAHAGLRAELEAARAAERALQAAEVAGARVKDLTLQIAGARERAKLSAAVVEAATKELGQTRARLGDLPRLESSVADAQRALDELQSSIIEHRSAAARAEERLAALAETAARAKETRAEHDTARALALRYDKLAKAFGRDGIPHKIIGNAVPELRNEANRLLSLLTDGRLTLEIDLVRQTKSASAKETLDISVWHNGTKRAYEMYSGGERLRIDFALRIALSRLLAKRANTRLETLVVDEGFGSQDAEGRTRLVEAIMKVRGDFRRILVITHVDELKDLFGVRLEVSKDGASGSRVQVASGS